MNIIEAARTALFQTIFLLVAISVIGSETAYAIAENCPSPGVIQFEKVTYQWKVPGGQWASNSMPRPVNNVGDLTLKSVKLTFDSKEGDVISCAYEGNGEEVVLFNGGSVKDSFGSIIHSKIIPVDEEMTWEAGSEENEVVCKLSPEKKCAFDVVVPLPIDTVPLTVSDIALASADKSEGSIAKLTHVKLHFAPGTAFAAYACGKSDYSEIACIGPMYVNGTYYLAPNAGTFCVEVNRFAGFSWGQYYFQVDEDYMGDAMKWWGVSIDPQFTLPKGIRLLMTTTSRRYTGCSLIS
jgi:hypothetical protein